MKIYGFPLSPFVRKVHLACTEKGVAFETVLTNPREPSPEFLAASPFRKIPAMTDGDYSLADSTAIVTYVEAKHPENPIIPAEPKARGKAIWFEEFADTIMVAAGGKIVFNRFVGPKLLGMPGDEEVAKQGETELAPLLDYLEGVVPASGWLAGAEFSIGDIAVASVLRTLCYVDHGPKADTHPGIAAWYERVTQRPAWQSVAAAEDALLRARTAA